MTRDGKNDTSLYGRFFNEADAAMAILGGEGFVVAGNRKFENLLESLSRRYGDILKSGYFTLFHSSLLPLASGRRNYAFFESSLYLRAGGKDVPEWFNVHAWRIRNVRTQVPGGAGSSLIGIRLEDNTLGRREEKKLKEDKRVAEKAVVARDRFLAGVSHEIRTPIQTIIGMIELLEDTGLDHEQAEYSRQVKFSAEVLLALINDILDFSKIEAGRMELECIDFDLERNIEQAVEMITLEAHKKDLYIATDIPPEANIMIRGDPLKFRQVVINLVKNAVKFTREGGVVVSLAITGAVTGLPGAEALRVSVADTGIGVSEEKRARLFSSFTQGDAATTRRFGGTGLGLAISRDLVRLMKGVIEMVPNEGGGSIFRFTIPLERSVKKTKPLPPPEKNGKLKILVAGICVTEREIMASYLRDLGYGDIVLTGTGEDALKTLRSAAAGNSPFDLCFIDMTLPVMDGWRLAAEINNDKIVTPPGGKPPDLVLMMPRLTGGDIKMTLLQWFRAYINKPVKRRRLAETIAALLNEPEELEELNEEAGISRAGEARAAVPVSPFEAEPKRPLVLIVEDHPVNQKLFLMIVKKLGCPAIAADDGADALEKVIAHNVGFIFMDIQMPRMNGYEAAESLRRRGFDKPIVAVTAGALSDERERCLEAGIDDVLTKPFKRADIEMMLSKWGGEVVREPAKPETGSGGSSSLSSRPASVFDPAELLDTFLDNGEMAKSLLLRFIERTRSQLERLPGLVKAGDWETARRDAHMIKGAALTMTGTGLGNAAARLEEALKKIDREEIKAAYPPALAAFKLFRKEAEKFVRKGTLSGGY